MKKKKSFLHSVLRNASKAVCALFVENHLLKLCNYSIESPEIPQEFDGLKILQLSDLHSKRFGRGNSRLLEKIKDAKPDFVVMTGDMISRSDTSYEVFFSLARILGQTYPCYYIIGNHEQDLEPGELHAFLKRLAALKIQVLNNEKTVLHRGNSRINLYGMWFSLKYYRESKLWAAPAPLFGERELTSALGKRDSSHYSILLTHNPLAFPAYAEWGADLTLCGHIHGGMIRLPFFGGLLSPERKFFPEYSAGIYERDGKKMLVSRGLGSGTFGIRMFNIPEIVLITLHAQNGNCACLYK